MRTTQKDKNVAGVLFSQIRRSILALLFTRSDESFYGRQIARMAGGGAGSVHRELENLVKAGVVHRTKQGRQVYYQANHNSPVYYELHGLVIKTVGVADVLKSALAPLADNIRSAFIYGSFARGEEKVDSDIDVMVIGDVDFSDLVKALTPAEKKLHREINPSVFTPEDFSHKIKDKEHFVTSVMSAPRITLIGDNNEP